MLAQVRDAAVLAKGLRVAGKKRLQHVVLSSSFRIGHCRHLSTIDLNEVKGPHGAYQEVYNSSIQDPEGFWTKEAEKLVWFEPPKTILQQDEANSRVYHWFPDGLMNTCYNCLDVHVNQGRGNQDALLYDSPVTGVKARYTYQELLDEVSTFAGALTDLGVEPGDVVLIYMPMIPEAAVAMLACSRIGASHSVVFGGFASQELASRITDCNPKVVVSASVGVEPTRLVPYKPLLDQALELATHNVQRTVIVQRSNVLNCELGDKDVSYEEVLSKARKVDAVPLRGDHMHYLLYTSGTTGIPKGVVRETAGWAVALKHSMSAFYDTNPGETMFTGSDIGWAVGHAYTVYGPLLNGCSTVMYEGKPVGTPDAGAYWRLIEEYNVKTLFVAPTAFRAVKQADPLAELVNDYDLSSFRALFLAGEHSDPDTLAYCARALEKYGSPVNDVIDHWWQTELGFPAIGNAIGLGRMPLRPGACTAPAPGYDARILDNNGHEITEPNALGNLVLKYPLPPGTFPTLYKNNDGFVKTYLSKFPGFYDTSDAAYRDEHGYYHIMGRTDDLINTAGHRLSTGAMEEVLQAHPEVAECAVIPMRDSVKGQVPVGFVITNKGCTMDDEQLKSELIQRVRESIGAVASFKKVGILQALPKTRSGKVLRGTMSKIANGDPYKITPTIEDPNIFSYLEPEIRALVGEDASST